MTEQAHPREIIRVDNLVQTLGDQEILRGFSLKVHPSPTFVVLRVVVINPFVKLNIATHTTVQ